MEDLGILMIRVWSRVRKGATIGATIGAVTTIGVALLYEHTAPHDPLSIAPLVLTLTVTPGLVTLGVFGWKTPLFSTVDDSMSVTTVSLIVLINSLLCFLAGALIASFVNGNGGRSAKK